MTDRFSSYRDLAIAPTVNSGEKIGENEIRKRGLTFVGKCGLIYINVSHESSKVRIMKTTAQSTIKYENPPIDEIVCGVRFDPIKQLQSGHFGILWQKFRPDFRKPKIKTWSVRCLKKNLKALSNFHYQGSGSYTKTKTSLSKYNGIASFTIGGKDNRRINIRVTKKLPRILKDTDLVSKNF